jgi:hypothetical protein
MTETPHDTLRAVAAEGAATTVCALEGWCEDWWKELGAGAKEFEAERPGRDAAQKAMQQINAVKPRT